jgi:hypothetical protein
VLKLVKVEEQPVTDHPPHSWAADHSSIELTLAVKTTIMKASLSELARLHIGLSILILAVLKIN